MEDGEEQEEKDGKQKKAENQANNSSSEEDNGKTAEGLQEDQNTDQHQEQKEKHKEGDTAEVKDNQAAANAEGLKESQGKEAAKAAVTVVVASAEQTQQMQGH